MDRRMKAPLVNDALLMALWKRKSAQGLVWHTDRGSQYASDSHRDILKDHHVTQSMSRKGNCWVLFLKASFIP
jgi:transposase InsO family protein